MSIWGYDTFNGLGHSGGWAFGAVEVCMSGFCCKLTGVALLSLIPLFCYYLMLCFE